MDEGRSCVFYITEGERFFSQREKRLKEYGGMPLALGVMGLRSLVIRISEHQKNQ